MSVTDSTDRGTRIPDDVAAAVLPEVELTGDPKPVTTDVVAGVRSLPVTITTA